MTKAATHDDILNIYVTGKLTSDDYAMLGPRVQENVDKHDKSRLLFELHGFDGWTPGALWEDLEFDVKHFNDIDRVAIVGETHWQEQMARLYKPFTRAAVRFFPKEDLAEARRWLSES